MTTILDYTEYDSVVACADLVARTGAQRFEVGYIRDDPSNPGWYATAFYRGARLFVDEKAGPDEACDGLARRLLAGGSCTNCKRIVTLNSKKPGCVWHRDGESWVRGCDGKRKATKKDETGVSEGNP